VALFSRFRLGSDGFAVKVETQGRSGGGYSCSVWGRGEAQASGVAAIVAERLLTSPSLEHGVFHIEQPFEPIEFFARVEEFRLTVDLRGERFKDEADHRRAHLEAPRP
jgi:hypothetical protein